MRACDEGPKARLAGLLRTLGGSGRERSDLHWGAFFADVGYTLDVGCALEEAWGNRRLDGLAASSQPLHRASSHPKKQWLPEPDGRTKPLRGGAL